MTSKANVKSCYVTSCNEIDVDSVTKKGNISNEVALETRPVDSDWAIK